MPALLSLCQVATEGTGSSPGRRNASSSGNSAESERKRQWEPGSTTFKCAGAIGRADQFALVGHRRNFSVSRTGCRGPTEEISWARPATPPIAWLHCCCPSGCLERIAAEQKRGKANSVKIVI